MHDLITFSLLRIARGSLVKALTEKDRLTWTELVDVTLREVKLRPSDVVYIETIQWFQAGVFDSLLTHEFPNF